MSPNALSWADTILTYVNDLPDQLFADSLLYTNDVKLIAPRDRHDILQSPLNVSSNWSKDWELDLNPTKSELLAIGYSPHFIIYTFPSHSLPNAYRIPKFSTSREAFFVQCFKMGLR